MKTKQEIIRDLLKHCIVTGKNDYGCQEDQFQNLSGPISITQEDVSVNFDYEGTGNGFYVAKVEGTDGISFWKIPYYESSDGWKEWECHNAVEVKPVEKTIIVWE